MKKLLSIVLLTALCYSCMPGCVPVQIPIDKSTKMPLYRDIVFQSGMSQEEMFLKANVWLARTFVDSKSVISYSDSKAGYIIGKGNFSVYVDKVSLGNVSYVIEILVKDGKAQISLDQFKSDYYGLMTGKPNDDNESEDCVYNKIHRYSEQTIKEFKTEAFRPSSNDF